MSGHSSPESAASIIIRRIPAAGTHSIRHSILRPGMPPDSAVFPGDDDPATEHFGAFRGSELVGVASIYSAILPEQPDVNAAWQLRGMATLPTVRGLGCGRALLEACSAAAAGKNGLILWCNARATAVAFYERHGWKVVSEEFVIATAGPHFRMAIGP